MRMQGAGCKSPSQSLNVSVCTFAISTPLLVGSGAIVAAIVVVVIIIFAVVLILLKMYNRYRMPWALMVLSLR